MQLLRLKGVRLKGYPSNPRRSLNTFSLQPIDLWVVGKAHTRDIGAMVQISREIINAEVLRTKALELGVYDLFSQVPGLKP